MSDPEYVLDASALIALLQGEPGAERVDAARAKAVIGTVNLCEVVTKLQDLGFADSAVDELVAEVDLDTVDFDASLAMDAGRLRRLTRSAGLSLGDRACLALGRRLGARVLTTDRAWAKLDLGVTVELIR